MTQNRHVMQASIASRDGETPMPIDVPVAAIAIRRTHAGSHASAAHNAIMARIREETGNLGSGASCTTYPSPEESQRETRAQAYAAPGRAVSSRGSTATARAQQAEGSHTRSLRENADHCVNPAQHTAINSPATAATGTPPQHVAAKATAMAVISSCSTISFTGPSLLHPHP